MGYLRQPTHIEKSAFFKKLKEGFKKAMEWSPVNLANKAVKSVTGIDAMGTAANAAKTNLNTAAGGLSSIWKGATDSNQSWWSRALSLTGAGMMFNGAKGAGQGFMNSMGGKAHTNLG